MDAKVLHVLIVDDSDRMRSLLRTLLEDLPFVIDEARDGEEAVERYASFAPDLVLMDVRMPRMDGIAATAKIMAIDPAACVVIVTEHNHPAYRDDAHRAGARMYFTKDRLIDLRVFMKTFVPCPN